MSAPGPDAMDEWLLPPVDDLSRPFFEGALAGELRIPCCPETGRLFFPPRAASPFAPHRAHGWKTVSGRGTIWSFVVAHPPLLPAWAERAPYLVVAVALDEEPTVRLVGNLVAEPGGAIGALGPDDVAIGAPVRVVFEPLSPEIALARWVRV